MALRHPPRHFAISDEVGPDNDSDSGDSSDDDIHANTLVDAVPGNTDLILEEHYAAVLSNLDGEFRVPHPISTASNGPESQKPTVGDKIPERPVLHPFETDFSPCNLIAFMRANVEKLNQERKVSKPKEKGKQKQTAAPPALGLSDTDLSSVQQLNLLSRGDEAPSSATRHSSRLLRKDESSNSRLNPLAAPFEPQTAEASTKNRSSRAKTFEEYTKNKRNAVRDLVQEPLTSPVHAKLSQATLPAAPTVLQAATNLNTVMSGSTDDSQGAAQVLTDGTIDDAPQASAIDDINSITSASPTEPCTIVVHEKAVSKYSFNYAEIVPESIPPSVKKSHNGILARFKRALKKGDTEPEGRTTRSGRPGPATSKSKGREDRHKSTLAELPVYPRVWEPSSTPGASFSRKTNRLCRQTRDTVTPDEADALWLLDEDLWVSISRFLSTTDVKNLRLVSKSLSQVLAPVQLRNVVVNFDRGFFNTTMFDNYGTNFNQLGVSFEYDLAGLCSARNKVIEHEQSAWFGKFTWPTENYPRFPALQTLEDLVDNNQPVLKEAFAKITNASELGLCIDSGHGWLEGADTSDLALFEKRIDKGSPVFGKTFPTEDVWVSFARNELFRWGQQNTINTVLKAFYARTEPVESQARDVKFLESLQIRDIDSFTCVSEQYDYNPDCHTGGAARGSNAVPANAPPANLVGAGMTAEDAAREYRFFLQEQRRSLRQARDANRKLPQWPVIFNGYNLAAEHGGHLRTVQTKTSNPYVSSLTPGVLTEAQAQWLMETVWAQRAFLVAYTMAIITNKTNFRHIHTLRISKLSSGLLPSLESREFWKNLPGLRKLEMYLSPDWRQEHVIGDKGYARNMRISPAKAAEQFSKFLMLYITKLDNLHYLSVGYVGGGEHAAGLCGRNRHVLSAPIVEDPTPWLHDQHENNAALVAKFDHVRELTFVNCWFTPWLLKAFMNRSRDTSLHSLTLDSVSMTPIHVPAHEKPLSTVKDRLGCLHGPGEWARENVPEGAAWAKALDAVTPGKQLIEYKYEAGLIDEEETPMPERGFRGNVEQIVLKSCGYVKISVPASLNGTYNQNSAVVHTDMPADRGLLARKSRFHGVDTNAVEPNPWVNHGRNQRDPDWNDRTNRTMLSSEGIFLLGTLTQCVHPVEKRILEQAWQLKFGWGDDLRRWAAVEDGYFEGGTGRFSGVILKDG